MYEEEKSEFDLEEFEIFPWNDNLLIPHEEIDKQHKVLVDMLNSLARALVNDNELEVDSAFKELANYADYHFKTEEEYWEKYFPDDSWYTSHKTIHESFLPKVKKIRINRDDDNVAEEVIKFLIDWLAFHILDSDKRMSIAVDAIKKGKNIEEAKKYSRDKMNGSLKTLTDTILMMYDNLTGSAIKLMKERKIRLRAEKELKIANENLKHITITDPLTKLYNRRHFNDLSAQEFRRSTRNKTLFALLVLDIDYFKKVNDTKGHQEGDRILEHLGKIIKENCRRPIDFPFRIGGEEFIIMLINQDQEGAETLAGRINKRLQLEEDITLSCGIVVGVPQKRDSIEDWFKKADEMLYTAKDTGRNRIVSFKLNN